MMKLICLLLCLLVDVAQAEPLVLCNAAKGLDLINRDTYSTAQIEMILNSCDKVSPNSASVLLLHGLFARKSKQDLAAIKWFEKAQSLDPDNQTIRLELATTDELISQFKKAQDLYQLILLKNPQNRAAFLGLARVLRLQGDFNQSVAMYQSLLSKNQQDVDALNGMGWVKAAQNDLSAASKFFNDTLALQPQNVEATLALDKIKQTELQKLGPVQLCDAVNGLHLLNQKNTPLAQIKAILVHCASNKIDNADTQLLQGLLARQEGINTKHFKEAIAWLHKAVQSSPQTEYNASLELAVTYEWAGDPKSAQLIYQNILTKEPSNRPAALGLARVFRSLKKFDAARHIYQELITKNTKDIDARNGLGWLALAQNNRSEAMQFFRTSLGIQPTNTEALLGLKDSEKPQVQPQLTLKAPLLCDADRGLILMNQVNPPLKQIKAILIHCDKNTPNATSVLLLHGLLERHLAKQSQNYNSAIAWLTKAIQSAASDNDTPLLELAVTYEWAGNYKLPLIIYQSILAKNPHNKIALLGKARVLRFSYQINSALALYQQLLEYYPNDATVLSGQGETYMANYEFAKAREAFNTILAENPTNKQAASDLALLDQSTKNLLDLSVGHYSVPPNNSDGMNLYYFRNLNATDGLTLLATHNTRQIESSFGAGTALLPNDSLLIGYQHLVPKKFGWQLSYDARDHHGLPFEHRVFGSSNIFLKNNLEWFGGARLSFPSIWNTQLLISGFNIYTSLPVNITATGFWSFQEIGGYSSSYALDFSKEYNSHLFYDLGPSYLVEQQSFEVHGKLIVPVFKNQALVFQGSHYFFNNSTFINAGWRVYWA